MPNENCLEGMRCPKCGSYGPFDIYANCTFRVDDYGAEQSGDVAWDDDSRCWCYDCQHGGDVKGFGGNTIGYMVHFEDEEADDG